MGFMGAFHPDGRVGFGAQAVGGATRGPRPPAPSAAGFWADSDATVAHAHVTATPTASFVNLLRIIFAHLSDYVYTNPLAGHRRSMMLEKAAEPLDLGLNPIFSQCRPIDNRSRGEDLLLELA